MRFAAVAGLMMLTTALLPAQQVTQEELQRLYKQPSTFESIPKERWIAESANAFAVRDRNPQTPVHLLVIPKTRVPTLLQAPADLIAEMMELAKQVAQQEGISQNGFRIIINTNPWGGQTVYHFHMHVLGGRELGWSPGFREDVVR